MPTLKDYSVKFGRDPSQGLEGKNAFPFFYSLVNHNDVDWTPVAGNVFPDLSTYTVLCNPGVMTPWYVRLDPDYNYKLIAIKYSVYAPIPTNGVTGYYDWFCDNYNPLFLCNPDLNPGTPYSRFLRISLSAQGSGSTTLLGGQNVQAINNTDAKIPLAVECMQGYEYGFQALRCEYLLPLQGILSFEFYNTHPTMALRVAAMMYGMKIRL